MLFSTYWSGEKSFLYTNSYGPVAHTGCNHEFSRESNPEDWLPMGLIGLLVSRRVALTWSRGVSWSNFDQETSLYNLFSLNCCWSTAICFGLLSRLSPPTVRAIGSVGLSTSDVVSTCFEGNWSYSTVVNLTIVKPGCTLFIGAGSYFVSVKVSLTVALCS
jgi:hypothetical protein